MAWWNWAQPNGSNPQSMRMGQPPGVRSWPQPYNTGGAEPQQQSPTSSSPPPYRVSEQAVQLPQRQMERPMPMQRQAQPNMQMQGMGIGWPQLQRLAQMLGAQQQPAPPSGVLFGDPNPGSPGSGPAYFANPAQSAAIGGTLPMNAWGQGTSGQATGWGAPQAPQGGGPVMYGNTAQQAAARGTLAMNDWGQGSSGSMPGWNSPAQPQSGGQTDIYGNAAQQQAARGTLSPNTWGQAGSGSLSGNSGASVGGSQSSLAQQALGGAAPASSAPSGYTWNDSYQGWQPN